MLKNQLIEILKNIKGNPEIMIWNGIVEDVQPIAKEVVECKLYKMSFEGYKERVNLQRVLKDNLPELPDDELKTLYKKNKLDNMKPLIIIRLMITTKHVIKRLFLYWSQKNQEKHTSIDWALSHTNNQ